MKRILGVYDADPFYAERFAEFANQKERIPFTVVAFTSLSKVQAFSEKQPIEILLVGNQVDKEQLKEVKAGQILELSESREGMNLDNSTIYKYQSSDAVLREVMACYQIQPVQNALMAVGIKSMVIGVYSPINRCGKTSFSMIFGQVMAKECHVLLISLEEHSALSRLTGTMYMGSLSDLIYYYRQGEYSSMRLGSVIYNWGGMDYVPPAVYAEDLAEIQGEELAGLITKIALDGGYDRIIVDMGNLGRGMEPLLEMCQVIYTPIKEDCVSSAKMESWKDYLEKSKRSYLWEKVKLLKLPRLGAVCQTETYLEQLLWGEMGDFVRNLWKGQNREH
ncbi:ParA family protein [Clostridiaceae bacterium]|nr:ParA family protein [Clostridiaceae bacterium]